jgi:hypothetical protein
MRSVLVARIALIFIGVLVWGYGKSADLSGLRLAGIGILAAALLLRFVPRRWFDDRDTP